MFVATHQPRTLEGVTDAMIKENVTKVTATIRYIYSVMRGVKRTCNKKFTLIWLPWQRDFCSLSASCRWLPCISYPLCTANFPLNLSMQGAHAATRYSLISDEPKQVSFPHFLVSWQHTNRLSYLYYYIIACKPKTCLITSEEFPATADLLESVLASFRKFVTVSSSPSQICNLFWNSCLWISIHSIRK